MRHLRIIIADDSEAMRRLLHSILKRLPFTVEVLAEATNGEEAVQLYRQWQPDVMFTDMIMPALDGLGVLQAVRGEFPDARIVLVTSISDTQTVLKVKDGGAMGYILKPFEPERVMQLTEQIHRELSLSPT